MDEKEFLTKLSKKIRHLRKLRRMSQEELAFKAGIDRSYMGNIERGESSPTIITVFKISRALKVNMPQLLCFDKIILDEKLSNH